MDDVAVDRMPSDARQSLDQMLGGLESLVGGVGGIRTQMGSAHGRGDDAVSPESHVAALAVNSACTLALFFCACWERRPKPGSE